MVPKLFGRIRERYADRPGGYTRVLRIEPMKEDQAESAILELVDGPKDMRFVMTAKTLARLPENKQLNERTAENVKKVTMFRENGMQQLRNMVLRMRQHNRRGADDRILPPPRNVYPEPKMKREMHYYEDVDNYRVPNRVLDKKAFRHSGPKKAVVEEKQAVLEDAIVDAKPIHKTKRARTA
jgi:large subunit ribosomal protein L17